MLKELAEDVYVETGFESGNVGLIRSSRGALLIDTPMLPSDARQWRQDLLQLGMTEIYGIVNTDYHPEHVLGNAFFMPTRIWGHELSIKQINKYKASLTDQLSALPREDPQLIEEINQVEVYFPEICVGDRATLYIDERVIEIVHLPGHTPASLGVYLPKERILFAGDNIVQGEHPIMSQANSLAWLATLERIRSWNVKIIVPSSGQVCGPEAIDPLAEYIAEMRRRVMELFQSGASRRECVDKVGMLEFFPIPEAQAVHLRRRRRENVERVYTEIRTAKAR